MVVRQKKENYGMEFNENFNKKMYLKFRLWPGSAQDGPVLFNLGQIT